MTEYSEDSKKILAVFQQIRTEFTDNECKKKELSLVLNHQKKTIENFKETERKYQDEIKSLRQICASQTARLSELYEVERKSEKISEENLNLKNRVQDLQNEIFVSEVNNNKVLDELYSAHRIEIENMDSQFKIREKELQEQLEGLQASSDFELAEKDGEIRNMENSYEKLLKEASHKKFSLENEIYRLNSQLSSNAAISQKKIDQLEQKLKSVEQTNFVSAKNAYGNVSNSNQTSQVSDTSESQNRNSFTKNLSKIIEKNTEKKFHFQRKRYSKSHSIEKKLLNESFNPFEMHKQMSANQPTNESHMNVGNTLASETFVIDDYSENSYNSQHETKMEDSTTIEEIEEMNNVIRNISQQNRNENKNRAPPIVKKRKLFNPKNTDYLG